MRRDERPTEIDLRDKPSFDGDTAAGRGHLRVVSEISDAATARPGLQPHSVSLLPGVCPMWDRGETWDSAMQRPEVVSSSAGLETRAEDAPRN